MILGIVAGAIGVGFAESSLSGSLQGRDGVHDAIYLVQLGAVAIGLFWFKSRPAPTNRVSMAMAERADRYQIWALPVVVALSLLAAGLFLFHPEPLSPVLLVMPLMVLTNVLSAERRRPDEWTKALVAHAYRAAFYTGLFGLVLLGLTARYAPDWTLRLLPMALAVTVGVLAGVFVVGQWRADQEI